MKQFIPRDQIEPIEEDIYFEDPILVTGCARSGTSLTASIIKTCGAWTGQTVPASMDMPTGFVENYVVRQTIIKPLMKYFGADILGQASVLHPDDVHISNAWADEVGSFAGEAISGALFLQGLRKDTPWLLKDARFINFYPFVEQLFPKAKWVVVRRDTEDIVRSCAHTDFMGLRGDIDWYDWVDHNEQCIDHLLNNSKRPVQEVCYEDLTSFDFFDIKDFVDTTEGLEWDEYEVEKLIL